MPAGDPGGHYASGNAVNQGGPVGLGGSGGLGGSNVRSAYGGSQGYRPGYTISFGWQPSWPGQPSPEQVNAFTNPSMVNYGNMMGFPTRSFGGSFFGSGAPAYGGRPAGAAGANSGQGGMGAGRWLGANSGQGGYRSSVFMQPNPSPLLANTRNLGLLGSGGR